MHMIDPMHFERVSHDDVMAKWGVPADRLGDVLALAGDSSDNIPGGKKRAIFSAICLSGNRCLTLPRSLL